MSLAHYAAVQQVAAASQEFEFNHHLDGFQILGFGKFFQSLITLPTSIVHK